MREVLESLDISCVVCTHVLRNAVSGSEDDPITDYRSTAMKNIRTASGF